MPGPVSDQYDPEFGTRANAADVEQAIDELVSKASRALGPERINIVEVVHGKDGARGLFLRLTERELRILRFALERARESI